MSVFWLLIVCFAFWFSSSAQCIRGHLGISTILMGIISVHSNFSSSLSLCYLENVAELVVTRQPAICSLHRPSSLSVRLASWDQLQPGLLSGRYTYYCSSFKSCCASSPFSFLPVVTLEGESFRWHSCKVEAAQLTESSLGEQLFRKAIQPTYNV